MCLLLCVQGTVPSFLPFSSPSCCPTLGSCCCSATGLAGWCTCIAVHACSEACDVLAVSVFSLQTFSTTVHVAWLSFLKFTSAHISCWMFSGVSISPHVQLQVWKRAQKGAFSDLPSPVLHSTKACVGSQCQPSVHSFCRHHRNCVLHLVFPVLAFFFFLSCFFSCRQQVPWLTDVVNRISCFSVAKELSVGWCDWKDFTWLLKIWPNCFFVTSKLPSPAHPFRLPGTCFLSFLLCFPSSETVGPKTKCHSADFFSPDLCSKSVFINPGLVRVLFLEQFRLCQHSIRCGDRNLREFGGSCMCSTLEPASWSALSEVPILSRYAYKKLRTKWYCKPSVTRVVLPLNVMRNSWMQLRKNCHISKELIIVGSPPASMPEKGWTNNAPLNLQCPVRKMPLKRKQPCMCNQSKNASFKQYAFLSFFPTLLRKAWKTLLLVLPL